MQCINKCRLGFDMWFVARDMEHFSELSTLMMEMDIGIKNISFNVEVKKVKNAFEMPLRSLLEKKE